MARIVIVGASEASRTQLSRLLASSGYDVFRICASDSELRRALSACQDGIVIFAGKVNGILPDELASDFADSFRFLLIGRPEALGACESPRIFRLGYPCPGSAVTGAVEILSQMHAMDMPRRTGDDRTLVEQAKAFLMHSRDMTEAEAHRAMQQYAMRHGIRMTEYAASLLQNSEGMEE